MSNLFQENAGTNRTIVLVGIIFACLIGLGGIGFFFINRQPAASTAIETSIPIEKIIEMTFSAAGAQTAALYSPTPPPSETPIPAIVLLPTITIEPTLTFLPIPALSSPTSAPAAQSTSRIINGCDPGDQAPYVYSPNRLIVLSECIHVTGIISEIRYEDDGDLHILLKLDREFQHYLKPSNPGNTYLIVEPVCVHKPTQPNAVKACALDPNPLTSLPKVGQHVWMEGRYVTDTQHNDWAEIHPLGSWGFEN